MCVFKLLNPYVLFFKIQTARLDKMSFDGNTPAEVKAYLEKKRKKIQAICIPTKNTLHQTHVQSRVRHADQL